MAQTADVDWVIPIVEIALAIGRKIVLVASIFIGINITLAAYNFATSNVAWGIVHSLLGVGGLVFLA